MLLAKATQAQFPTGGTGSELEPAMMQHADRTDASPPLGEVLQGLLALCASELQPRVAETLTEFERQIVRLADKATIHEQNCYIDSVRQVNGKRADIAPRFLRSLEDTLEREHQVARFGATRSAALSKLQVESSDSTQLDESQLLSEIAIKVESRQREPLYALGHRFGALAGTPCVPVEAMPLAPRSIAEAMRYATCHVDLPLEHRLVMYRCFERVVMNHIGAFYEALNHLLVEQGILPHLNTLPTSTENVEPHGAVEANPMAQTELAIKLKLKLHVAGLEGAFGPVAPITESSTVLSADAQAALDRLHTLPHGTWFEFTVNGKGDTVRRKLSWYSAQTGRCVFMNQYGEPCEAQTLRELASDMAAGRARVGGEEPDATVDQSWSAICATLRNFSRRKHTMLASGAQHEHLQTTPTLLLVDDEVNIQHALVRTLRNEGYRILTAANASAAMKLLGQHEVQVILSDQRMPGLTGTELLGNVKAMYPNTMRILLSGFSDAAAVTDAINHGAIYNFLTKPWDEENIRLQLREAFDAYDPS